MQKKKTYKATGLFVLIGLISLCAVVYHFVSKQFSLNSDELVVMYFEESISGLSVGSSVVFKGVEVGKVAKIKLLANLKEGTFQTPVYVEFIDNEDFVSLHDIGEFDDDMLDRLIVKGLRARLTSASLLTGQLMIELLMDPNTEAVKHGTGKHLEIPTVLSPFAAISNDLKEIPMRESLARLGNILQNMEENLPQIMENMTQITQKMNNMLDRKSGEASKSMGSFNAAMEELSKTSRSIKNLTDYLERHPEALLRGKEK